MPTLFFACLRAFSSMAVGCFVFVTSSSSFAQGGAFSTAGAFSYKWHAAPPLEAIMPVDIRWALIWTGHIEATFRGDFDAMLRQGTQAWQKSKGHAPTETLPDEQVVELVSEGLKQRDAVGWAILRDPAVGFSVGVPTKLVTFDAPRQEGDALGYHGAGDVIQSVIVHFGNPSCRTIDAYFARFKKASFRGRQDRWFVALTRMPDHHAYVKAICHEAGMVTATMGIRIEDVEANNRLLSAMSISLTLMRDLNPTARPRPKIEELPAAPMESADGQVARPRPTGTAPANLDTAGMTDRLKLVRRGGGDLRAEEIFEKAAGAVYMVKADKSIGSAVAVSETDLLTNCHVVGDKTEVTLVRDRKELKAAVVSMNINADRCVLRVEAKLPKWVGVRPYSDIKVGERALTIGTPQGLELTVAEGIVSSKRSQNDSRLIQTSAPISQGSSGGGLFDAQGELLGITTFYFKAGQNLNFAVAAEEFSRPEAPASAD
ncbi:MAG: serine protease [Reyranella sp.]|nr:serine protease [Reyranella sp.]